MRFQAVLFDVGETLWHSPEAVPIDRLRALAANRVGAVLRELRRAADPATVSLGLWRALEAEMAAASRDGLRERDYAACARQALAAMGVEATQGEAERLLDAAYVSGAEAGKRAYDDAAAVLQELRGRGLKVGMVTNRAFGGPRFRGDLLAAGLDFEWDAEAVSVEVGYKKPHPRIFEHALAALGLRARAVLMVGNSLAEDVAGAQRLGMAAAWRRSAPDAEGVAPDFVFDELSELLALPGLAGAR